MTEQVYNFNVANAPANNNNPAQPVNNTNQAKLGGESASPNETVAVVPTAAPTTTVTPQFELKVKRIRMLRILAIKTAAILDWNLLTFEKE